MYTEDEPNFGRRFVGLRTDTEVACHTQEKNLSHQGSDDREKRYILVLSQVWAKDCWSFTFTALTPLRPKIDQQQFNPKNIKSKTRGKVIRIDIVITQGKIL